MYDTHDSSVTQSRPPSGCGKTENAPRSSARGHTRTLSVARGAHCTGGGLNAAARCPPRAAAPSTTVSRTTRHADAFRVILHGTAVNEPRTRGGCPRLPSRLLCWWRPPVPSSLAVSPPPRTASSLRPRVHHHPTRRAPAAQRARPCRPSAGCASRPKSTLTRGRPKINTRMSSPSSSCQA